MRNVSKDSPFDPLNKPPRQYLEDDFILEKPGKLNLKDVRVGARPLAGKMSDIGEEIIRLGSYKAKHLVTGNWDFKYKKPDGTVSTLSSANSRRTAHIKPTSFNPFEYQPKKLLHPVPENNKKRKFRHKANNSEIRVAPQTDV